MTTIKLHANTSASIGRRVLMKESHNSVKVIEARAESHKRAG
jgi:hypothetical protein